MVGAPTSWLPADLVSDVSNWGFANTASSAMQSLGQMGASIMAPLGSQIAQGMQQITPTPQPAPAPAPMPAPPPVPDVQPFSLGKPEDWLRGFGSTGTAQPASPQADPTQNILARPAGGEYTVAGPQATGAGGPRSAPVDTSGFTLPPASAWLTQPVQAAAQVGAQLARPAAPAPGAAPVAPTGAAALPSGPIVGGNKDDFLRTAGPIAAQVEQQTGVPAKLSVAMAANETGWGNPQYVIGNNFHGIHAQAGEPAITSTDHDAAGRQYTVGYRKFDTPAEGFQGFANFLTQNPRYGPALAAYQKTHDVNQLAADITRAGYAEDPNYAQKVQAIMAGIPDDAVRPQAQPPALTAAAAAPAAPPVARQPTAAPGWGTYTPETLIPNQISEGAAQGLTTAEALAVCGPAAAVAFARANGRNPSLAEAKQLAQKSGVWNVDQGMAGPASEVQLLGQMGVPARLQQGADPNVIAQEVSTGRPVIIDTPQHYFVATGYDPQTQQFQFGNSAGILRAAKGRTSFRLDELPSLGMGAPRATILMGGGQ